MKRVWGVFSIGCVFSSAGFPSQAQTALPEIVVTAPSPIQPPRVRRSSNAQSAGPQIASTRPANPTRRAAPRRPRPLSASPQPAAPPAADNQTGLLTIADRAFAPVTIVTRSELERSSGASLGDVLMNKPGISGSAYAAGANRPIIRGLDNNRVRMQENGIGAGDVSTLGEDHGVPIDPLASDRLEVIRGPATLRWGSQAIGGVVNAENNRIPGPQTREGVHGELRGALSSTDRGSEGAALVDARQGQFAFHADYVQRNAGDYDTPHGRQPNTSLNLRSGSVGGSYIFDNGYIGASISQFNSLYHIPGLAGSGSNTRIDMAQTKVAIKGEFNIRSAFIDTVRFWFGGAQYRHYERGLDDATGRDTIAATFKNREYEGRIETQLVPVDLPFGQLTTAVGVQYGKRRIGTSGEAGGLLDPTTGDRIAAYIFNEVQVTPVWRVQAAARIERVSYNGFASNFPADYVPDGTPVVQTPASRAFTPGSVSIGVLRDLPFDVVASLTGQYVQRAPEALELFGRGAHDATATFEIGNPNLRNETAQSIEFGLRRARGPFRFDFSAYYTRYQGFISKRLTGLVCDDDFASCGTGTELRQLVYTQRDATFAGAELSAQYDAFELSNGMLGFDGQFDVVRARFTDGTNVPRIPPVRLGGGVFWRSPNWFARIGLLHAFAQKNIDPVQETPTNGYNLLRAEVSYNYKWTEGTTPRELTIGLTGTNLLNADVRISTSFLKDEVLQPGRGVRLFAAYKF
jgi:iron complex outermembrane receptor protein